MGVKFNYLYLYVTKCSQNVMGNVSASQIHSNSVKRLVVNIRYKLDIPTEVLYLISHIRNNPTFIEDIFQTFSITGCCNLSPQNGFHGVQISSCFPNDAP